MRALGFLKLTCICVSVVASSPAFASCSIQNVSIGPSAEDAIFKLQPSVDAGDKSAAYRLGWFLLRATWLERPDLRAKGLAMLQELAREGSWVSALAIGDYYSRELKDDRRAFPFYLQAAKAGYAISQGEVGRALLYGEVVERNEGEALDWLQKAARQNISWAHYHLFKLYSARAISADTTGWARFHLEKAAFQNFTPAQVDLARLQLSAGEVEGALFWSSVVKHVSDTKIWDDKADVIFNEASVLATTAQVQKALTKSATFEREYLDRIKAEFKVAVFRDVPSPKDPVTGCSP